MKNIFDGWLRNFVQESNTVIPLDLYRFVEPLFGSHSLAPFLGFFGNFLIFLLATKLCADAFWHVLETSSVIPSLPKWSSELALAYFWYPHVQKNCLHDI